MQEIELCVHSSTNNLHFRSAVLFITKECATSPTPLTEACIIDTGSCWQGYIPYLFILVLFFCRLAFLCSYTWVQRQCTTPTSLAALQEEEESGSLVHSSESESECSELFALVLAARAVFIKGVRAILDFSTQEVHSGPGEEGAFAACKYVCT